MRFTWKLVIQLVHESNYARMEMEVTECYFSFTTTHAVVIAHKTPHGSALITRLTGAPLFLPFHLSSVCVKVVLCHVVERIRLPVVLVEEGATLMFTLNDASRRCRHENVVYATNCLTFLYSQHTYTPSAAQSALHYLTVNVLKCLAVGSYYTC